MLPHSKKRNGEDMEKLALQMEKVTKKFGNFFANEEVDLSVRKGEIHALIGENGAGKSTLMNIVAGIYKQTSGHIYLNEEKVEFNSPKDALNKGVGMIYQHFKLVENMTVLENVIAGTTKKVFVNKKNEEEKIEKLFQKTKMKVSLNGFVKDLSISEKQIVEIVKVLYRGAELLILDEPTAVLTPQETRKLFDVIRAMKTNGATIIIITHKLNEIMEISDRVTVLRGGKKITTVNSCDISIPKLTNLIVGKSVHYDICRTPCTTTRKDTTLVVSNLTYVNKYKVKELNNIGFYIKKGEVLGVAGVGGSGQKPLCEILAGILPISSGNVIFNGYSAVKSSADKYYVDVSKIKVGFVPESRLKMGLVGELDMIDNLNMRFIDEGKGILYKKGKGTALCSSLIEKLNIKSMGPTYPVKMMSGGNIQKVLLGREMNRDIDLLIVAYPVRGLDTQTTHLIYELLDKIKQTGIPILFVAEDLDHIMAFSDRIMTICQGEVMGVVKNGEATKDEIGQMMIGNKVNPNAS